MSRFKKTWKNLGKPGDPKIRTTSKLDRTLYVPRPPRSSFCCGSNELLRVARFVAGPTNCCGSNVLMFLATRAIIGVLDQNTGFIRFFMEKLKNKLTFYFVPGISLDHFRHPKSIFRYRKVEIL